MRATIRKNDGMPEDKPAERGPEALPRRMTTEERWATVAHGRQTAMASVSVRKSARQIGRNVAAVKR